MGELIPYNDFNLPAVNQLLLWFWPQSLNIARYSSVLANTEFDSILNLSCVSSTFFRSMLFQHWGRSRSRKVFDESLLVLQRRDHGVSAGEKHCGRANHTCGARRLFLDSPSEDVSAFFFFSFFPVSSELLKLVRFQTRLHKY